MTTSMVLCFSTLNECKGSSTLVRVSTYKPKQYGFDSRNVRGNLASSLSSVTKMSKYAHKKVTVGAMNVQKILKLCGFECLQNVWLKWP